jgi:protein-disulfide isomerase
MHRALFAAGGKLDDLDAIARSAGLDVGLWRASLGDARNEDRLARDAALAGKVGADGTPTFFINGRRLAGAQPIERFRAIIDEEQARAEALLKSGTPAAQLYDALMAAAPAEAPAEARRSARPLPGPAPASERVKVDLAGAPLKGDAAAPVTVVVFSDFQCPFCARAVGTLRALEEKYGDRVRFAFKQRPLSFHGNARTAAAAALAAADQGKFWQFHDALFAHQQELDRASLERRAEELGLDLARFRTALDAGAEARIAADEAEAERLGVTGTPTFFVNGRKVVGAQPPEVFAAVIDEELRLR